MEYICDKVMFVTKFEKLHINFKTRVGGGMIVYFFIYGVWYLFRSIKYRNIFKLMFFWMEFHLKLYFISIFLAKNE
jgi:hypothetical protein